MDALVVVGPNMFYTVTLPCTLWFLDRGIGCRPILLEAIHDFAEPLWIHKGSSQIFANLRTGERRVD